MPPAPTSSTATGGQGRGLAFVVAAYALWGVFPLYFLLFAPATPFEVVAFRVLLSLVVCVLLMTAMRLWRPVAVLARRPRVLGTMALAGLLIYVNWLVYVIAVLTGHVVEAALGYFITPLFTVLLGVLVLRERLRAAQWAAVGIAAAAVLVIALGYGSFPTIAVLLAASFSLYGLLKNRVGAQVDAVSGLTLETAAVAPLAAAQLVVVAATTGLEFGANGAGHALAMLSAGVVTAIPLLLFAAGARRLPLVAAGLAQFVTPILQFLVGVVVLREDMPLERWIGFALVWLALAVLTLDMLRAGRAARRASPPPP